MTTITAPRSRRPGTYIRLTIDIIRALFTPVPNPPRIAELRSPATTVTPRCVIDLFDRCPVDGLCHEDHIVGIDSDLM